jgi:hypothetical protein
MQIDPNKYYFIPGEQLIALLNYLATRPYGEVAGAVQALMALPPAPEPDGAKLAKAKA